MKKNQELSKRELRRFGLILALIIGVLFVVIPFWFADKPPSIIMSSIIGILTTWSMLLPQQLKYLYRVWMRIGEVLGWINTRLILGIVFVLLFLPIGIMMKIMGKDPMRRGFRQDEKTYRVASDPSPVEQLEKPY